MGFDERAEAKRARQAEIVFLGKLRREKKLETDLLQLVAEVREIMVLYQMTADQIMVEVREVDYRTAKLMIFARYQAAECLLEREVIIELGMVEAVRCQFFDKLNRPATERSEESI